MKKLAAFLLLCFLLLSVLSAQAELFSFDSDTGTITGWSGTDALMSIPETIDGITVRSVSADAFRDQLQLKEVHFPSGLETIGKGAFSGCSNLGYIVFQSSLLPAIAPDAFSGCALTDVDIPWDASREMVDSAQALIHSLGFPAVVWRGNVPGLELPASDYLYEKDGRKGYVLTSCHSGQSDLFLHYGLVEQDGSTVPVYALGTAVFKDQKQLKRFGVPHSGSFTTIGEEAFAESGLEWIDLFDTVTVIGEGAFRNCIGLTGIRLTDSLQKVGANAFEGCSGLRELYLGCGISVLPRDAFADCSSLNTVTIDTPEVREGLFKDLPVSTIIFTDKVETIYKNAFQGTSITELVLPETLRRVESGAFDDCLSLEKVTVLCDASVLPPNAFTGCSGLKSISFAKGSIPADLLSDSSLETLFLSADVTEIGQRAFSHTALKNVVLPADARLLSHAFEGVPHESIRMADAATDQQIDDASRVLERPWYMPLLRESEPESLQSMPELPATAEGFVFDAATGTILSYTGSETTIVIPRYIDGVKVQAIASMTDAYGNMPPAESVVVPETVTHIAPQAFQDCNTLKVFLCYGPLDSLGEEAFAGCTALEEAIFINGIRLIGDAAFQDCTSLKKLWWYGTVDKIGEYAFSNTALDRFSARVRVIGEGAFSGCLQLRSMHLRECTEKVDTLILDGCTSLETLCLEWSSEDTFVRFARLGTVSPDAQVILPADTNLKRLQAMYRILSAGNGGPVVLRDDILLEDCSEPKPDMPDAEKILRSIFH